MTKKVTYICDRCGVEFDEYDRDVKISVREFDYDEMKSYHRWLDLCSDCEKDMNKFFNGEDADIDDELTPDEDFDLD